MNVSAIFTGTGQQAWTVPADGLISEVAISFGGGVDASVSVREEDDPALLTGADGIFDQLIALFSTGGSGVEYRSTSAQVLAGQSVYFSADGSCNMHAQFVPLQLN